MVSQPPLLIADEIVALGAFGSWLYCDVHVGVRLGHKPDPLSREVYFFFAMGFFALGFFALGFFLTQAQSPPSLHHTSWLAS